MISYKTISDMCTGELTEKHSRFICTLCPVQTDKQAVKFIDGIKSKYWDARHNTYAYSLRESERKRYSDDGEPKSTAGLPMLEVLEKNDITDVVAVVTRYFGGILLGTGGLVRAYSGAVRSALNNAKILSVFYCKVCTITADYSLIGKINSRLIENNAVIDESIYAEKVKISFHIEVDQFDRLIAQLNDAVAAKFDLEIVGEKFLPC